ncbi:MAG: Fic family protein [Bacteriovoracaceae bacterium]|nr:Fic family protein [Bacteriovoracaceae bacterium]
MKIIGYEYLRQKLTNEGHKISRFRVETHLIDKGRDLIELKGNREIRYLRSTRKSPKNDWEHLIFGLTHEGVHIPLMIPFFRSKGATATKDFILSHQAGKYHRIIWFYYEELIKERLSIPDTQVGRYAEVLNQSLYYTGSPSKIKRYKIVDNRIGHNILTPIIRKGVFFKGAEDIRGSAKLLLDQYAPELIEKSVNFLYVKETKKSNEIEKEHPDKKREARFVELLKRAHEVDKINEKVVIELQNAIVDPRYAAASYREFQTYIGVTDLFGNEAIHYICPKAEDNRDLMASYEHLCKDIMEDDTIDPIIAASVIPFLFVYLHPVEDGNGRIHRFLIHYVLSKKDVTPKGMIFPVSAVIAANIDKYDKVLENFSNEIVPIINYELDELGQMTVLDSDTKHLYLGIDLTKALEFISWTIKETLVNDFKKELEYMKRFFNSKDQIRKVVDIPDRKLNILINSIINNQGRLSQKKRKTQFSELTDDEIKKIEAIVRK